MDMPTSALPIAAPWAPAGTSRVRILSHGARLPSGCAEPAMAQGERGRRLLRRGEALFRAGDALRICISCAPAP